MKNEPKVVGFEMLMYSHLGGLGRVLDYRMEYGAGKRDIKSLIEQCREFISGGIEFSVHPLVR